MESNKEAERIYTKAATARPLVVRVVPATLARGDKTVRVWRVELCVTVGVTGRLMEMEDRYPAYYDSEDAEKRALELAGMLGLTAELLNGQTW